MKRASTDEGRFERHTRGLLNSSNGLPLVYYGEHEATGLIKIGSSSEPLRRCVRLHCQLLATESGGHGRGRRLEGQRLRQFAHARIPGTLEWFDGGDIGLRHWISLVAASQVPTESRVTAPSTYTVREASEVLGVSEWTIRRMVANGSLPRLALAGRVLRLPARVVDAIARGERLEEAR